MRRIRFSYAWPGLIGGFVSAACLLAIGCGGGGGGGGKGGTTTPPTTGLAAKGKVTLPSGFKLPLTQLRVLSDSGQAAVNPDGTFTSPVVNSGYRMVQLIDNTSGKVVMLGFVNAGSTGSFSNGAGAINPTTTADALLFCGTQGPSLTPSEWDAYFTSIFKTTPEATVASVVAKEVVTDPTALGDGDSAILSSVATVQSSYTAPAALARFASIPASNAGPAKAQVAVQRLTVAREGSVGALIKVEPSGTQSSLQIAPNPNGDGIVPVSTSRRRGEIFVYKVGVGPDTQHITPLNPPQEVNSNIEVEPTEEIHSVQVGFLLGLQGKFAYLPVTNEPIFLDADPVAEIAVYDVVCIGNGPIDTISIAENAVAPNSAAARTQYDKEWKAALLHSQLEFMFKDVIVPLLIEFVLTQAEAGEAELDEGLEQTLEAVAQTSPSVVAALNSGDLKGAASAFMTAVHNNLGGARDKTIAALEKSLVNTGAIEGATFDKGVTTALNSASACIALIGVVNKGIAVADVTQGFHDNTTFNNADEWVADVLQPVVTLTPQKSSVDTNDPLVHLSVKIQNVTDLTKFRFEWSSTNLEGKLESSSSTANLGTGIITDSTAVYVTDFTKFAVGTVDTVTVRVFSEDDTTNPIGTATATIKGAPSPCTTTPAAPIVTGPAAPVISLSELNTRPGDTFTVTVNWPADGARTELLEVSLFSAPGDFTTIANKNEAAKLISVDGIPAKIDTKDVFFTFNKNGQYPLNTYPTANTATAQTHKLVFQMLEPTDPNGNPEPYCSILSTTSSGIKTNTPPYVIVDGFGSDGGVPSSSQAFFNENP